jgi:hypothetical protein
MNLSLAILLGISGLGTVFCILWVFAIWKTGGFHNFYVFENGETVPNNSGTGCSSSLKGAATMHESRR